MIFHRLCSNLCDTQISHSHVCPNKRRPADNIRETVESWTQEDVQSPMEDSAEGMQDDSQLSESRENQSQNVDQFSEDVLSQDGFSQDDEQSLSENGRSQNDKQFSENGGSQDDEQPLSENGVLQDSAHFLRKEIFIASSPVNEQELSHEGLSQDVSSFILRDSTAKIHEEVSTNPKPTIASPCLAGRWIKRIKSATPENNKN